MQTIELDGTVFEVVFDGAHRHCDADLFRTVQWDDPKSPDVPINLGRLHQRPSRRKRWRKAKILSVAEVRARVAQIRAALT